MPTTTFRAVVFAAVGLALSSGCSRERPPEPATAERSADDATQPGVKGTPTFPGQVRDQIPPKSLVYNRVVAVCIGIDKYGVPNVQDTPDSERGAAAVAKAFRDCYRYECVELLGERATRDAILKTVTDLATTLGERDALIVYFAGHGRVIDLKTFGRAGYLVPYAAELDFEKTLDSDVWAAKAIGMHELLDRTRASKAQHVLFLLDACASGFMTTSSDPAGELAIRQMMARRSRTVIAATTSDQVATSKADGGIFTSNLRRLLDREDAATVSDLFGPLRDAVVKDSKQTMLPRRGDFGSEDGEFVFFPAKMQTGHVRVALEAAESRLSERSGQLIKPEHFHSLIDAADYRFGPDQTALEKVWREQFVRFRDNSHIGDPLALPALAICYAKGLGTDKNPEAAYSTARLAADLGRPEGLYALGYCLLYGIGSKGNEEAGLKIWLKLHETGSPLGTLGMVDWTLSRRQPNKVLAMARADMAKAVKGGLPIAELRVADAQLRSGKVAPEELSRLLPLVRKLAEGGNPVAMFRVYGLLTAGDEAIGKVVADEAFNWLLKSATCGYAPAQAAMAYEYYQNPALPSRLGLNTDVRKKHFLTAKWAVNASRQRNPSGYKVLALLALYGHGQPQSLPMALGNHREVRQLDPKDTEWVTWFEEECLIVRAGK